jgi:hypothetical protein
MRFRLYVVETLGGVKADVSTLKQQNADQYLKIDTLQTQGCAKGAAIERDVAVIRNHSRGVGAVSGGGGGAIAAAVIIIGQWLATRMGK